MPPKIVFLDAKTVGDVPQVEKLRELGELILYQTTRPEQTAERTRQANVLITNKVVIDRQIMDQSPELRLICVAATGLNNVDVEYARQKSILVKNVVGYSTHSVAQHTFAMLFYLLEQLKYYDAYVADGGYAKSDIFTNLDRPYWELANKTFGIIGLGTIGRQVAKIAEAFGANVIYYSTSGKNDNAQYRRVELNELLATSDVVSIHAPLNDHTRNLLTYESICRMKPSAILLNSGRGGIIHEAELVRALDENRLAGVGLDVLETEPMLPSNPLLSVKNKDRLLITPHIAWASREARAALMEGVYQNIAEWIIESFSSSLPRRG